MERSAMSIPQPDELRFHMGAQLRPAAAEHENPEEFRLAVLLAEPSGKSTALAWVVVDENDSVLERELAERLESGRGRLARTLGWGAEKLIERWISDGEKTYVYTNNGSMRETLRSLKRYLPNLGVLSAPGPRSYRVYHDLRRDLMSYADDLTLKQEQITVATDASMQIGRSEAGVGYITEDGRFHATSYANVPNILHAELLAVRDALRHLKDHVIKVMCDNRQAVALMRAALEADVNLPALHRRIDVVRILREIRFLADERHVEIAWVRGHAGHHLNEAADRLAIAARRTARSKLPPEQRQVIIDQIVADIEGSLPR